MLKGKSQWKKRLILSLEIIKFPFKMKRDPTERHNRLSKRINGNLANLCAGSQLLPNNCPFKIEGKIKTVIVSQI